ncbi:MAG: carbamoyl-phosphate synthase small subunit [Promethearchaeota archaeon CR_4]|nr:MAG: carbamoyl-phosphate synthase small subunit [Candidatus Lokiarchaeota archaeon CR_4]
MIGIREAALVLESGKYFVGTGFGATKTVSGELVFTTVTAAGYNAVLTDPSNQRQIFTMTFPTIGNYGVPAWVPDEFGLFQHFESDSVRVGGFVVYECCKQPSHWESTRTLDTFLQEQNVPGIEGVDTRAITRILRSEGLQKCILQVLPEGELPDISALQDAVHVTEDINTRDLCAEVSIKDVKMYNTRAPEKIVIIDMGVKHNIIRNLCKRNFCVVRVPYNTSYEQIMTFAPKGIVISNGPGDPKMCKPAIAVAKQCIDDEVPLFGICLGNQIIGLAAGGNTYRLKYGHRGGNKPCIDLTTNSCYITTQNHSYVVDPETIKGAGFKPYFTNVDDKSLEGLYHPEKPVFSVQFHPEAFPGPRDPNFLFDKFEKLIRGGKN